MYERLKREKGDRSFSELIAAKLDEGSRLMDVTGNKVLDPDVIDEIDDEINRLSDRTVNRLEPDADAE